jgi:hypothetical protein
MDTLKWLKEHHHGLMARLPVISPGDVADEPMTFGEFSLMTRNAGRRFTRQEILAHCTALRRVRQLETTASAGSGSLGRFGK